MCERKHSVESGAFRETKEQRLATTVDLKKKAALIWISVYVCVCVCLFSQSEIKPRKDVERRRGRRRGG